MNYNRVGFGDPSGMIQQQPQEGAFRNVYGVLGKFVY
jgi:hypothetical protein